MGQLQKKDLIICKIVHTSGKSDNQAITFPFFGLYLFEVGKSDKMQSCTEKVVWKINHFSFC